MAVGRSSGGTYHYAGCGCTGLMPLPLPGMVDDAIATLTHVDPRPLRIMYLLPHHNLTGGMKMLVQQMAILKARGHQVIAAFRSTNGGRSLPPWSSLTVAAEVLLSPSETYEQFLRRYRGTFDVAMVGYFTQLAELDNFWGPLLYWEQGHEHLFAEGREPATLQWDALFHYTMLRTPIALAAVSDYTAETLAMQFGRRCFIIPNGIDCTAYFPPEGSPACEGQPSPYEAVGTAPNDVAAGAVGSTPWGPGCRVLLVGSPGQAFKGWDIALHALNIVHCEVPALRVTWICQSQPQLSGVTFPLEFVVNPPQEQLPHCYRYDAASTGLLSCLLLRSYQRSAS